MKRHIKWALAGMLAIAVAGMTVTLKAEDKPAADKKDPAKRDNIPFGGKVTAVDKSAQTFTVGKRTFQVIATSRIMKEGKPATFEDIKDGEEVGGQYKKSAEGKLEVLSLRIGAKPEGTEKPKKKKE